MRPAPVLLTVALSLSLSPSVSPGAHAHTILLKMSPDGEQEKEGGSIVGRMFVQLLTGTAGINHKRIFLWQATWGKQENRRLLREIFTSFAFNVANWPPASCSSSWPPPPPAGRTISYCFLCISFLCVASHLLTFLWHFAYNYSQRLWRFLHLPLMGAA